MGASFGSAAGQMGQRLGWSGQGTGGGTNAMPSQGYDTPASFTQTANAIGQQSSLGNIDRSSIAPNQVNIDSSMPLSGSGGGFFTPQAQGAPQPFTTNTTTPVNYQAASYPKGSIAEQLASGYQQIFGRAPDTSGLEYWTNKLGGQNLSQGEVNRYLIGGAGGTDIEAGKDYALSLTGGRPSPTGRQYMQPIYQPTYTNYAMNRGFYSPGYAFNPFMGGGGYSNPFMGGGGYSNPFSTFYGGSGGGGGGRVFPAGYDYAEGGEVDDPPQGIEQLLR